MNDEKGMFARAVDSKIPKLFSLWLGSIGFVCGFFGGIYRGPSSNLAPINGLLVGILMAGPLAAVLGWALGLAVAVRRAKPVTTIVVLCAAIVATIATIVLLCQPPDEITCFIVDAEVVSCEPPDPLVAGKLDQWEKRVRKMSWVPSRPGWKDDIPRMLTDDPGLVLKVKVKRMRDIYAGRKPWNKGQVYATHWGPSDSPDYPELCYLRTTTGSCADYRSGMRLIFLYGYDHSDKWPPDTVPSYLMIPFVSEVPPVYRRFVDN